MTSSSNIKLFFRFTNSSLFRRFVTFFKFISSHVEELELGRNCAKWQVGTLAKLFATVVWNLEVYEVGNEMMTELSSCAHEMVMNTALIRSTYQLEVYCNR